MRVDSRRGIGIEGRRAADPASDDEEGEELELDDVAIDEAALPELDMEDPEAVLRDQVYDDLLDRRWLEPHEDEEDEEERSALDHVGLTIDLAAAGAEDEAEEVDLDVGALLSSLPAEESELDAPPGHERDGGLGAAALRELLLPGGEDGLDDREIGDDDRFPVFDDGGPRERPSFDDDGPEGEPS